jgi:hypothetical protein
MDYGYTICDQFVHHTAVDELYELATSSLDKRDLLQCQKRPITVSRAEDNTSSLDKREARLSPSQHAMMCLVQLNYY